MSEIISMRTSHSKTFYIGGGKRQLIASIKPIHYEDNGAWHEFDLNIVNGRIDKAVYVAELLSDWFGYTITDKETGQTGTIRLVSVAGQIPAYYPPIIEGNKAIWKNIVSDIDLELLFHPYCVRGWRTLHTAVAGKEIVWEFDITSGEKLHISEKFIGNDNKKRVTRSTHVKSNQNGKIRISETFTGKSTHRDPLTRARVDVDAEYPVRIDADIDVGVAAGADDGSAYKNATTFSSFVTNGLVFTLNGTAGYTRAAYIRFVGITIPSGATIDDANLALTKSSGGAGGTSIRIRAKNINNAVNPTSVNQVLTPASLCTNVVAGTFNTGTNPATKNFLVTTVVQEMVNTNDFTNAPMLFFVDNSLMATTQGVQVAAYEHLVAQEPRLIINYTAAGGGSPSFAAFNVFFD